MLSDVNRRDVLAATGSSLGAVALPAALSDEVEAAVPENGGATLYDGVTYSEYGYDYAPSVMIGDGPYIKMWWCSGASYGDGIWYSELTGSGWTDPTLTFDSPDSGWDSAHVCDPSVVKGSFVDGQYDYAMYYTGSTREDDTDDEHNNHIGVAFSNNPGQRNAWTPWPHNPVITSERDVSDPDDNEYGAGLPTAYRHGGTNDDVTVAFYDSTTQPENHYSRASDGVTFSTRTDLPDAVGGSTIDDIAFHPDESRWYVISDWMNRDLFVYKTENRYLDSSWDIRGRVNVTLTGNSGNHNSCWMRHPNGTLYESGTRQYKYIFFGVGARNDTSTWDIGQARYVDGWEFDNDGDKEGWTSYNVSADGSEPSDGSWKCIADQPDPNFVSPRLRIGATNTNYVVVNMSNHNYDTNGKIYFQTKSSDYLSESKSVSFDVHNDGGWHTYKVYMDGNGYWDGEVTRIRVDPIREGSGDPLGIGYVRLDG